MFYAHRKAGKLSKCGSVYEYPGTVETAKGKQSVERVRVALRLRIVSKATKLDDVRFFYPLSLRYFLYFFLKLFTSLPEKNEMKLIQMNLVRTFKK